MTAPGPSLLLLALLASTCTIQPLPLPPAADEELPDTGDGDTLGPPDVPLPPIDPWIPVDPGSIAERRDDMNYGKKKGGKGGKRC